MQAIEWHVAEEYTDVSIYDGSKIYSIHEFASAMALQEIADTVTTANDNEVSGKNGEEGWQQRFEDPILLADGRTILTLRQATDYITSLTKSESGSAEWRIASEALGLASLAGSTALARIPFVNALTRNTRKETGVDPPCFCSPPA